jgi:iron-sulfur cluster insertion protein
LPNPLGFCQAAGGLVPWRLFSCLPITLRRLLLTEIRYYSPHLRKPFVLERAMSALAESLPTAMPDPIVFTDSAAAKVADLIAEEGNPDLKLRVFVQGGGCSGFQYGFTFDEITNEDDTTMTKNGVSLLVDAMSYQYLLGAEIDYKEDLQGAQFVIKNPNATSTCGCGSSFSA